MAQNVAIEVEPRRDLDQGETVWPEPEEATRSTNFVTFPSVRMRSLPSWMASPAPPAEKFPTKTTFLLFWLMLMNPPQPAIRSPKRLALTLPTPSHSANPRTATSRPPPSMKSNCEPWSITAWLLIAAPNSGPLAGTPPMTPGSTVNVRRS